MIVRVGEQWVRIGWEDVAVMLLAGFVGWLLVVGVFVLGGGQP